MKLKKLLLALVMFSLSIQNSYAQSVCTLNGKEVPCSEMPTWIWVLFGSIGVAVLLVFIFWLWMLVDAIKNQQSNKLLWILLIIFTNGIGAVLYYFLAKRPRAHMMHDLANPNQSQSISSGNQDANSNE